MLPVRVLVDSGADGNFIDSELCSQAIIPTKVLRKPKEAQIGALLVISIACAQAFPLALLHHHPHLEPLTCPVFLQCIMI